MTSIEEILIFSTQWAVRHFLTGVEVSALTDGDDDDKIRAKMREREIGVLLS